MLTMSVAWHRGVGKDMCVPRGLDIMQGVGSHLRSALYAHGVQHPLLIADDVPRNIDSAHALARGLGLTSSAVAVNGSAFFRCKPPSKRHETSLIAAQLKAAAPPPNVSGLVAAIDRLLGGRKRLGEQTDKVEGGKLKGRIELASMAAETFLMQYGAGLPVAWGELTPVEMYALQQMHVYEWAIDRSAKPIEQAKSSHMLAAIVDLLGQPGNATTIFVGHDTDLNGLGVLLEVGWRVPPFPDNTTAPNVALRFHYDETRAGGRIAVDVVYTTYGTTDGVLLSAPVLECSAANFCERAAKGIDPTCAPLPTSGLCEHRHWWRRSRAMVDGMRKKPTGDDVDKSGQLSWIKRIESGLDQSAGFRPRTATALQTPDDAGTGDGSIVGSEVWDLTPVTLRGSSNVQMSMYGSPSDAAGLSAMIAAMQHHRLGSSFDPVGVPLQQLNATLAAVLAGANLSYVSFGAGADAQVPNGDFPANGMTAATIAGLQAVNATATVSLQFGEYGYFFHCLQTAEAWWHLVYTTPSEFAKHQKEITPVGLMGYRSMPTSHVEAYTAMTAYVQERRHDYRGWMGSYLTGFGHYSEMYAARWGAKMISLEVGENIGNTQSKMSFARGSSRRYRIPWSVQVSPWYMGGCTTHGPAVNHGGQWTGSTAGHSISFVRRNMLQAWFTGAALITPENSINSFFDEAPSPGNPGVLSPHGKWRARSTLSSSPTIVGCPLFQCWW
jgi:hypothetical protein